MLWGLEAHGGIHANRLHQTARLRHRDDELSKGLNLQDETFSAKLGAKVGPPEAMSPGRGIDFQDPAMGSRLGAKIGNEPGGAAY
jgi:hypothetical protein